MPNNNEYLNALHSLLKEKGYKYGVDELKTTLESDSQYLSAAHSLLKEKGYKYGVDELSQTLGLKKKEQSESGTIQPSSTGEGLQQPQSENSLGSQILGTPSSREPQIKPIVPLSQSGTVEKLSQQPVNIIDNRQVQTPRIDTFNQEIVGQSKDVPAYQKEPLSDFGKGMIEGVKANKQAREDANILFGNRNPSRKAEAFFTNETLDKRFEEYNKKQDELNKPKKDAVINHFEREYNDELKKPKEKEKSTTQNIGSLVGGVMEDVLGASLISTIPFVGVPASVTTIATKQGIQGAGSEFRRAYIQARSEGHDKEKAYAIASKASAVGAVTNMVEGAAGAITGIGGDKIGKLIKEPIKKAIAKTLTDSSIDGAIAGVMQFTRNVNDRYNELKTEYKEGIPETVAAEFLMGAATNAISEIPNLANQNEQQPETQTNPEGAQPTTDTNTEKVVPKDNVTAKEWLEQQAEANDTENIEPEISGKVGGGQKPVETQPIESTGGKTTTPSGVLPEQEQVTKPESTYALDRQVEMLVDDTKPKNVVMFTKGETPTALLKDMAVFEPQDNSGNVFYYNPQKVDLEKLQNDYESGNIQKSLYYDNLKSKKELEEQGLPTQTVSLLDSNKKEVLTILTDEQGIEEAKSYLNSLAKKGDTVELTIPDEIIKQREQAQQSNKKPLEVIMPSISMDNGVNTGLVKNSKGAVYHDRDTSKLEKLGYSKEQIDNLSQTELSEILNKNIENPNVETSAKIELKNEQPTGEVPDTNLGEQPRDTTTNIGGTQQTDTATGTGTTTSKGNNKQADKGVVEGSITHRATMKSRAELKLNPSERLSYVKKIISKIQNKTKLDKREKEIYEANPEYFNNAAKEITFEEGDFQGEVSKAMNKKIAMKYDLLENNQYEPYIQNIIGEHIDENGKVNSNSKFSIEEQLLLTDYANELSSYLGDIKNDTSKTNEYTQLQKELGQVYDILDKMGSKAGASLYVRQLNLIDGKTYEGIQRNFNKITEGLDLTEKDIQSNEDIANRLSEGYVATEKAFNDLSEINDKIQQEEKVKELENTLEKWKSKVDALIAENERLKQDKGKETTKEKAIREKKEQLKTSITDRLSKISSIAGDKIGSKLSAVPEFSDNKEQNKVLKDELKGLISDIASLINTEAKGVVLRGQELINKVKEYIEDTLGRKDIADEVDNYLDAIRSSEEKYIKSELPNIKAKMYEIVKADKNITLNDFIAKTKEEIPYLTEQDIEDILTGRGVASTKKGTVNEARAIIANLKREKLLIEKINDTKKGIIKETSPTAKKSKSDRLVELEKELDSLQKEMKVGKYNEENKFVTQLKQRTGAIDKQINQIERDIALGNYEKVEKKKSIFENKELRAKYKQQYDAYTDKLQDLEKAKADYIQKQDEYMYRNLSKWGKISYNTKEGLHTAQVTLRTVFAGLFDQSIVTVQLRRFVLANPIKALDILLDTYRKDIWSSKNSKEFEVNLQNDKFGDLALKSGVAFYGLSKDIGYENIGGDRNILNKAKFTIKGKEFAPSKAVERVNAALFNKARLYLFELEATQMIAEGMTWENNQKDFENLAWAVNELTAQGSQSTTLKAASKLISPVIWSSKMWASHLNTLGIGDVYMFARYFFRKDRKLGFYASNIKFENGRLKISNAGQLMIMNMLSPIANLVVLKMIIQALGKDDEMDIELNPFSGDYGNFLFDKKTKVLGVLGNTGDTYKNMQQAIWGKKIKDGETKYFWTEESTLYSGNLGQITKIVRGKMTPEAGLMFDYTFNNGYNYFNHKYIGITDIDQYGETVFSPEGTYNAAEQMFIPMIIPTLLDKQKGIADIATSFYGIKYYDKSKSDYMDKIDKMKAEKEFRKKVMELVDKNVSMKKIRQDNLLRRKNNAINKK